MLEGLVPQIGAADNDAIFEGKIASGPDANGEVEVTIDDPDFDPGIRYGPCPFVPRGDEIPKRGDRCLVVFATGRTPWVAAWEGGLPRTYAAAVSTSEPISWWRFDDDSTDPVAHDRQGLNHGEYRSGLTGAATLIGSDPSDSATSFNGTSGFVPVSPAGSLDLVEAVTLEAWIKPTGIPTSGVFRSVVTKAEAYALQFNGPVLEFTHMDAAHTRRRCQATSGLLTAGNVYHVVGTFDGANQRLYVNGVQVASLANVQALGVAPTAPLCIGSWDGTTEFFAGVIDEPAIYGRALTASEVAAHYAAGRAANVPQKGEHVKVRRTTNSSSIANGASLVAVQFNVEDYDVTTDGANNQHDNATNPERLTCRRAGIYQVSGYAELDSGGSGWFLTLRRNGTDVLARDSATVAVLSVSAFVYLSAGDYVELLVTNNTGASRVVSVTTAQPWLAWSRIGDTS